MSIMLTYAKIVMYEDGNLDSSEFDGEFSDEEKDAITEMIKELNKIPNNTKSQKKKVLIRKPTSSKSPKK